MSESAGKALDILFYLAKAEGEVSLARMSQRDGDEQGHGPPLSGGSGIPGSRGTLPRRLGARTLPLRTRQQGAGARPRGREGAADHRTPGARVRRIRQPSPASPATAPSTWTAPKPTASPPDALGSRRSPAPLLHRRGQGDPLAAARGQDSRHPRIQPSPPRSTRRR